MAASQAAWHLGAWGLLGVLLEVPSLKQGPWVAWLGAADLVRDQGLLVHCHEVLHLVLLVLGHALVWAPVVESYLVHLEELP